MAKKHAFDENTRKLTFIKIIGYLCVIGKCFNEKSKIMYGNQFLITDYKLTLSPN